MREEQTVRSRYKDRKDHWLNTDDGNKSYQKGYVDALAWVLEVFEEDQEESHAD